MDTGCGCGIDCPQEEIQECCFETTHECQSLFGLTEVMDDVDETGFIFCKNTDGSRPKDGCCGIRLINRTNTDKDKVSYRARYEIIENKNNVTINKYCVGNAQTDLNKHMIEAKKGSSWGQWITKSLYKSGPCTPFGTFSNNVKQEACSLFGKDCSGKGRVKVRTCVQFKLGE